MPLTEKIAGLPAENSVKREPWAKRSLFPVAKVVRDLAQKMSWLQFAFLIEVVASAIGEIFTNGMSFGWYLTVSGTVVLAAMPKIEKLPDDKKEEYGPE